MYLNLLTPTTKLKRRRFEADHMVGEIDPNAEVVVNVRVLIPN